MPAIFGYEHIVREEEIDGLGHVNNLAYIRWMQEAAVAHSAAQGWPAARYQDLNVGWVVRSHEIEYLRPAFAAEHVVVWTWVSSFRRISSIRKYRIVRPSDGVVLAIAATNWAFIDTLRLAPRRMPPEIIDAFIVVGPADEPA